MSSRSIGGEDPLYLSQAEVYTGSCAVGPCLVTPDEVPDPSEWQISLKVARSGADVYSDTVNAGDQVITAATGLGELHHVVGVVGARRPEGGG
jgi:fumarylacetoacetate (FAA) hydrolase family protein